MSGYSSEYNVLFIHIPKTAGTSMERREFIEGGGHNDISEFIERLSPEVFNKAFKFAFVRNPYSRFLSMCAHHTKQKNLGSFVDGIDSIGSLVYTQAELICDEQDNILVDFVGRFENLKEDWKYVCDRVGVPCELPYVGTRSAIRKAREPKVNYWTNEAIEFVKQRYARDFEIFDYEVNESKEVMPLANPLSTKKEV